MTNKILTYDITESWEREALSCLFGEEDIFLMTTDMDTEEEFDLRIEVHRVPRS